MAKTTLKASLGLLLIGTLSALMAPAPAAAVNSKATEEGVHVEVSSDRNPNYRARCRIGQSYAKFDYNNPGGRRTRYDIVIRFLMGAPSEYPDWPSVQNGRTIFTTGRLQGPGGPNREGYIHLDDGAGTIAVEAFAPDTENRVWTGLTPIQAACGLDYNIQAHDA